MTVNRVVTLLTPLFTIAAAAISAFVAKHLGLHLSQEAILAVIAAGATSAFGIAYKWLDGHQKWESYIHDGEMALLWLSKETSEDAPSPLNQKPTPPTPNE